MSEMDEASGALDKIASITLPTLLVLLGVPLTVLARIGGIPAFPIPSSENLTLTLGGIFLAVVGVSLYVWELRQRRTKTKARLAGLVERVNLLIDAAEWRQLSKDDEYRITQAALGGTQHTIHIAWDTGAPDSNHFSEYFYRAFGDGKWTVHNPSVIGPFNSVHKGLAVVCQNPEKPTIAQQRTIDVLNAAELKFDKTAVDLKGRVTGDGVVLLITNRQLGLKKMPA
jgi:hypothetical protein